jgi:hypothetical protein
VHHTLQNALRQKDAELKQANAELEERGKLLYKTKVQHSAGRDHTACAALKTNSSNGSGTMPARQVMATAAAIAS